MRPSARCWSACSAAASAPRVRPKCTGAKGARLGLRYTYELIDFDDLDLPDSALGDVLDRLEAAGFAGCNVTHPFKQAVSRYLTDLAPDAAAIGAVNTVVFETGRRLGHNTDAWGFAESFRAGMAGCDLSSVALFGAGGGGAAVGHALLQLGVDGLDIHDPDAARAQKLAQALSERFGTAVGVITEPERAVPSATGVVNATPIGMTKYPGAPFDLGLLSARAVGRRHHLLPARNRAAAPGADAWLRGAAGHRHGGAAGGEGLRTLHRRRARSRRHDPTL